VVQYAHLTGSHAHTHVVVQGKEAGTVRRSREAVRTADDPTEATAGPGRKARAGTARGEGAPLVLDRYRLVRRIGSGGFGVVWLAEDERLRRMVAVKRITMHDAATAARAEREARAAARLSHPGIVTLYESGRDAEAVYLVSELVRGRTLADLMDDGELSDRDVARIGVALCDALAHAHGRGVIHRDVKPGNVMVPETHAGHDAGAGVAKLTDFGVARMAGDEALTATGDVVGTLAYMAPEQADGRAAGEEADLYSLGLVLYEALSGVNPVRARGAAATARRLGARLPPLARLRRDLPLDLCHALDRAVQARREQRGTIADLRAALAEALPSTDDERGTVAGSPLEGIARVATRPRVAPKARAVAALAAGALSAAALAWLTPRSGVEVQPAAGAAGAALAVLVLPRAGWLIMAAALAAWAGGPSAAVVAAAAIPTVALLRRAGALWSLPAGAPLLGAVGLAGAWPALAAQAARPWHRAALGALGCWWLALAEVLTGDRLALGAAPGAALEGSHLAPLVSSGALALAALWAVAAVLLPVLVRGRRLAADLVGATAWAAALGSATQAVCATLSWQPAMRGLVAGAVVAGGLAVALAASRGDTYARWAS
jgi:eukaryotic-like serine/threonine-protein kinase